MQRELRFRVHGLPAPQGNITRNRYGAAYDATKALKPWRESVKWAALEAKTEMFDEAVNLDVTFFLPRPKSAPRKVIFPIKKPDLDKLTRGLCDALTEAGVWLDDSVCIHITARKLFAGEDEPIGAAVIVYPSVARVG